jgi:hypothetical protein
MSNYQIFISYRRKGGFDTAKLIYDRLSMDGYSVSFDIDTLENGNFDDELEKRIKKCKDFILVLSPGIFDCFTEEGYNPKDDWVRMEIACALSKNKNIVPLMLDDFKYPRRLPNEIKDITRKNSIDLNPKYFEAAYEKMKDTFLLSKPHWKTRHKKQVRYFLAGAIFLFVAFLFIKVYTDARSKVKEAELRAQKAELIRVEKEVELAQKENSINTFKDSELALIIDSINTAKDKEIALIVTLVVDSMNNIKRKELRNAIDSVKKYMRQSQSPAIQRTTTQPKTSAQKTTAQKSSKTKK